MAAWATCPGWTVRVSQQHAHLLRLLPAATCASMPTAAPVPALTWSISTSAHLALGWPNPAGLHPPPCSYWGEYALNSTAYATLPSCGYDDPLGAYSTRCAAALLGWEVQYAAKTRLCVQVGADMALGEVCCVCH